LLAWADDPREDIDLRRAAITALVGLSLMDLEFWDAYLADRDRPAGLRLAAALALTREADGRAYALAKMRQLRLEHPAGSRHWIANQIASFGLWLEDQLARFPTSLSWP
jgi:hypothetical protein